MRQKKRIPLIITIISAILGFMIAIQYQSIKKSPDGDSKDISQLRQDLQKNIERHQRILSDMSKYSDLLNQYESSFDKEQSLQVMKDELARIKMLGGLAPMEGSGIVLSIAESPTNSGDTHKDSLSVIYDDDLRYVVNELFGAGAIGISINDHRITSTTSIRNVGDNIQIDTKVIQLPFEIKAIGDPNVLESAIKLRGFEEYFKIINKQITLQKLNKLVIPAYDGKNNIHYLKPLKEGS
jgi:uncharacterized protein YlxW (UPF0749 family)